MLVMGLLAKNLLIEEVEDLEEERNYYLEWVELEKKGKEMLLLEKGGRHEHRELGMVITIIQSLRESPPLFQQLCPILPYLSLYVPMELLAIRRAKMNNNINNVSHQKQTNYNMPASWSP